jgi:hypothetical protein
VTYPYYGYYSYYDYPYFSHHGYADCGFYNGFYIRFGAYGSSYFSNCSGFGQHAYHRHHHHVYACATHGQHYYHIRDCYQCYPEAEFHEDVEVPDVAPVEEVDPGLEPVEGANVVPRPEPAADPDEFFASLRPAQLSFAIGLMHFREGRYEAATEAFYNASLEDPENRLVRVFLAESLFSIGEFAYSAEYLRLALSDWEEFPRYRWSVAAMYTNPEDFRSQLAALEAEAALHPNDASFSLVLGFVRFGSGDHAGAGESFDAVRTFGEDDEVRHLAGRFIRELEDRSGSFPRARTELVPLEDVATARFLASLELSDVKDLDMR